MQRTSQRLKWVIIASGSVLLISAAIFIYLNLSDSETSEAAVVREIDRTKLPVEMKVSDEYVTAPVTSNRQGRYKVARPLSETPSYPVQE